MYLYLVWELEGGGEEKLEKAERGRGGEDRGNGKRFRDLLSLEGGGYQWEGVF